MHSTKLRPPEAQGTNPLSRARWRPSRLQLAGRLVAVVGVVVFTVWTVTRSEALEKARAAYSRQDFRSAVGYALDHLDRRPWSRGASRIAALGLSQLNYPDEAEPYYSRAGSLSSDDQHVRAVALLHADRFARAVEAYEQLLAGQPDDAVALRRLAAAELGLGKPEEVLRLAERLAANPESAVIAETLRAVGYHEIKDHVQAVTAFERVLTLDPSLQRVPLPRRLFWEQMAEDLVAPGRSGDARAYLAKSVAETPDSHLMCLLGRAYQFEGAFEAAEQWLRRAAEGDPDYDLPHLYLGQIAQQQGRLERSRTELETAFRLSPRRYETAYNLSLTYRGLGRESDAERWRRRAARLRRVREPSQRASTAAISGP